MNLDAILQNKALIAGLIAWLLAQIIKLPLDYLRTRKWNWALMITTGGMPSSHSSLVTGTVFAVGLYHGFDNPLFALGVAITMIVTYDAAGVRRQAGIHAQRINVLFDELLRGHIFSERDLREVLGHTPLEVAGGILLGLIVATAQWLVWK
ncbi:MAG: divergent PAP2 family protein [Anaerolineales bacterium]|nr:divergent PAP2 family protein [Anaerolineales bacterium]